MAARTPSGTAIAAAIPVSINVPAIAGQIPPPGRLEMIGRSFVRNDQLMTEMPFATTWNAMKPRGMSATKTDPTIHTDARTFAARRRGLVGRVPIHSVSSSGLGGSGDRGVSVVVMRRLAVPSIRRTTGRPC